MEPVIPPAAVNNPFTVAAPETVTFWNEPVAPVIPPGAEICCDAYRFVKEPVAPVIPPLAVNRPLTVRLVTGRTDV